MALRTPLLASPYAQFLDDRIGRICNWEGSILKDNQSAGNEITADTSTPRYSLWELVLYMLRLGTLGFGGPVALAGYMHRDLVDERRWIVEADYKEGLLPSPSSCPVHWRHN